MPTVRFSVVVPATNKPATLEACLDGIRAASGPSDEIVLVDDGDSRSPARLRNIGARRAADSVLLFVDADVILHDDAMERLREAFEQDADLVGAFGSYDDEPPSGYVSKFRNLLHHHVHQQSAGCAQTFWAGLGAIRREEFLALGGFYGGRYPRPMLEDVELGLRLHDAGHRVRLIPEAQGRHLKRWALRGMLWSDFRNRGIPWTRLLLERREAPATLNLGWPHRLTALAIVLSIGMAAAFRRVEIVLVGAAIVLAINRDFYALLRRKGGLRLLAAGFGLHVLHHLVAILAVPAGAIAHVRRLGQIEVTEPITLEETHEPGRLRAVIRR